MLWENGGLLISKLISPAKPRKNPAILSKTKTKDNTQNSCSIQKYHPGAGATIDYVASRDTRSCTPRLKRTQRCQWMLHQVSKTERFPPRGHGHVTAKAMWPMETTGQCKASAPSEYGSQAVNDEQVKTFLCSPGSILVSGMGQTKCFLGMNN